MKPPILLGHVARPGPVQTRLPPQYRLRSERTAQLQEIYWESNGESNGTYTLW